VSLVEESGTGFGFQGAPLLLMRDQAIMQQRQDEVEKNIQQMQSGGGFPLPLYPQEWIEPRTDVIEFGRVKRENELGSG
jgi:hypothetical protein